MTYIPLSFINSWYDRGVVFGEYRAWMEIHVGEQDVDWSWQTGDLCARGVFFEREDDAIMFKLKFKI